MEQALSKIRVHTSSSLSHQKAPAKLLVAIESTFEEQKTERTPTAYFAALLTTLDSTIQKNETSLDEGDVLPAELYLLALVSPFVAVPVLRTHLNTLLNLTAPLFPLLQQHAPPLRSQLSLYQVLLTSIDRSQLETHGIRQAFATILQLCLDPRPKVRKKAAEVVKDVISKPPLPLARHPYAERVAEWTVSNFSGESKSATSSIKNHGVDAESYIHILAMLRPILANLPPQTYPTITNALLHLPRLGNPYLSQSAYSTMSDIFALSREEGAFEAEGEVLGEVLKTILSFPPPKTDTTSTPGWIGVLASAMSVFRETSSDTFTNRVPNVWKTIWSYLESGNNTVRAAAVQSLDTLCRCTLSLDGGSGGKLTVEGIVAQISKAFSSVAYTKAIPDLLSVTSSLFLNLQQERPAEASHVAAVRPLIKQIGDLRIEKNFEHKEAADAVLSTAMHVLGPKVVLDILPLNLEPEKRKNGEPRAFLLPLLSQPHPSPLSHFVSYFVPLSEQMFDLQSKAEAEGRQSEGKVWSVLVNQVWNGFPGYCHGSVDLSSTFTQQFSQLLSQVLYSQPELRPAILKGLKTVVESNVAIAGERDDVTNPAFITTDQAKRNVEFLRTQAENWLAVLFNVFGSVNRDSRGPIGEVISAWASIADESALAKAQRKVLDIFKGELPKLSGKTSDDESTALMALDLVLLLLPYLSSSDAVSLFQLCLSRDILTVKSNGVQKRAYKILTKLTESKKVSIEAEKVLQELESSVDEISSAAKKDRFNLLAAILPYMPSSALHLLPSMIPEAVLGTKETSDKARSAAFDLIIVMGKKMSEGGVVKRDMMEGVDEDTPMEAAANVEEFMKMVAGGLAGSTPHMVSATITAISRLVFEFRDDISNDMKKEIFATLLVFLSSANREIVKSVLGFVKLSIHTLPADIIQSHLNELVPALLTWSHDHKNHFKVKVRHIFERLLRRLPWEEVYSHAGNEDAAKVLVNIKKRKERAKRKKANKEEDDDHASNAAPATGDAFEDIIYGSESELDDSDDEQAAPRADHRSNKKQPHGVRLRMDDDDPMDLLEGVASRVTNASSNKRRKPGQDASRFKTDDDTGKMIIDEDESDEDAGAGAPQQKSKEDVVGTAYRESITSVDGFTRGPNGRIKFNKDTKKRRRENQDAEDDAMDVVEDNPKKQKTKQGNARLGHEFKAKRAGGDVKKNGVDPYAYLTLSQASGKKGGRKNQIGIAGKGGRK
ncbi:pre-rRNA processing protein [Marasmius crinis-equi]|uniref:Pre-rRNA processing protein n=1 Tax=Marasmius crinis-equi TaxID=585013 RepID=A0ABR3FT38_9AGAR